MISDNDNLPFIVLKVSPEGEILYANNYWVGLLGNRSTTAKSLFFDFLPPIESVSTALVFELAFQSKIDRFKSHIELPDKNTLVDWRITPDEGCILLWGHETNSDSIENSEVDLFQQTVEIFTGDRICLWIYHVEYKSFKISENGLRMFGIKAKEVLSLRDFIALSGIITSRETIFIGKKELEKTKRFHFDAKVDNPNTGITDIEVFIRSINDHSGNPRVLFGFVQDISERKKSEEKFKTLAVELQIQRTELEKSNKKLNDVLKKLEKTKLELEERERNYRQIFNSTSDAIFVHDGKTFEIVDVNDTMLSMYGFKNKKEVIGLPVPLMGEDEGFNLEKAISYLQMVIETRQKLTFEWLAKNKNGEKFWVEVSLYPASINNKEMIIASVRDISRRKKIQSELEYHTNMLRLVLNLSIKLTSASVDNFTQSITQALNDLVTFMKIDQAIIFGVNEEQNCLIKKNEYPFETKIPSNVPFSLIPSKVSSVISNTDNSFELFTIDEDSDDELYRLVEKFTGLKSILLIPLRDTYHNFGLLAFGSSNKARRWSEDELSVLKLFASLLININLRTVYEKSLTEAKELAEQREAHFRLLINDSPLGILNIRPDGSIIELNEAVVKIIGSPSAEMTKKLNVLTLQPLIDAGFSSDFRRCVEEKIVVRNEMPYRSVWGKEVHARYILTPIMRKDQLVSVLVNIEDFTEMHEARKNLIKLKEKAEESDRLKSVFLSNMSHEIRTPMNGIIGFAELLQEFGDDPDKRREFTRIIASNAYHLLDLINDIIDISRIESGDVRVNIAPLNINELILNVLHMMEPLSGNDIKLTFSVDLPTDKATILSDSLKIRQIFINLISNAIKFTEKGEIRFGYKTKDGFIECFVADTGKGIAEQDKEKIFGRFVQLDNQPMQSRTGTGLGLSICKAYVELLGGTIWVESKLGEGSTFYFTIPIKQSPDNEIPAENLSGVSLPIQWQGRKVVIVEDDEYNRLLISEILKPTGVQIKCFANAEEAIEYLKGNSTVDLVLMDLKLPQMDGIEATREIRKFNPSIPIVAQTAYAFSEDADKATKVGCNDLITKPMTRSELIKVLQKFL